MKKILALLSLLIFMVACSSSDTPVKETKGISTSRRTSSSSSIGSMGKFKVDSDTYVSLGRNERIQFVVVHYTATNNEYSIKELISNRVSAHFLVLDEDDNTIYNLVPLDQRAWHAGASSFRGRTNLNDTSIGIEIVSDGIARDRRNDPNRYPPYDAYLEYKPIQIEKVAQIIKYVAARYNIPARNIVAHSDIDPTRKKDTGAKFNLKELYEKYYIGAWYNESDKQAFMNEEKFNATSISDIKEELRKYGYEINRTNEWDRDSRDVVYAFQLHFNPKNATGNMDLETFAILKALNKKYPN